MKKVKKIGIGAFGVAALGCFALASLNLSTVDAPAETIANEADFCVYGGSVRVGDDKGGGVKFHVVMSKTYFENYGTVSGEKGSLDEGYSTGTLVLPYYLTNGDEITPTTSKVSNVETTDLWYETTIDGAAYMQSIVYLYNIPSTDYGTELSVRGYLYDGTDYTYTAQENGISMSFVAEAELNDENTLLSTEQLQNMQEIYLKKSVTYHYNGTPTTETVTYKDTTIECPEVAETLSDGSTFVGWATKNGTLVKNVTSTLIKNPKDLYAMYRQKIVLSSSSAQSISLANYEYDSVKSITYGTYNLGTNASSLTLSDALKADTQNHGEQNVVVTLTKDDKDFTVTMPVLFVTKEISLASDIQALNPSASNPHVYGYYVMTENISDTTLASSGYTAWSGEGFHGTLDGQNHTLNAASNSYYGIFSIIVNATIKNLTITDGWYSSGGLLAVGISNSVLENVTITCNAGSSTGTNAWISNQRFSGNTLKDVTINGPSSWTCASLFGINFNGNTFENVTINGTYTKMGNTGNATSTSVLQEELTVVQPEKVTLATRQDFVLDGDWSLLDLGEYNGLEILSVKTEYDVSLDGISPLSAKNKLTNLQQHGEQNFVVMVKKADGGKVEITVPVTVITKEIKTMAELQATVKHTNGAANIYGYYTLAKDVAYNESGFTAVNGSGGWSGDNAFRGTLDGRNYTITSNSSAKSYGLFGTMNQATLKNVVIKDAWSNNNQYTTLIARNAYNTKFENVTIKIEGGSKKTGTADYSPIIGYTMQGCTWTNVSITSSVELEYVFATQSNNTFENVAIKANVTSGFSVSSTATPDGVTLGDIVRLENTYDFAIDGGFVSLGEGYDKANVTKIEYGGSELTDYTALSSKLGSTVDLTLTVTANGATKKLSVSSFVITKAITTMEELENAVRYYGTDKDGYYILANDVSYMETGFALDGTAGASWKTTGGFIGTLDGRDKKITLNTNENNLFNGLFGTMNGVLKNVTIEAKNANNYSKSIIAAVCCGRVENVTINIYDLKHSDSSRVYENSSEPALVRSAMYEATTNVWKNVTVTSDCAINCLFPASNFSASFEDCVLNTPDYNGIYGTNKTFSGWTVNVLKALEITDKTKQVIDLNITTGEVNASKTYTLDVDGLTADNLLSVTCNGATISHNGLSLNVKDFGLTYGETELVISYNNGKETATHTVPALLVTKMIGGTNDLQNLATYADAYNGTTGDSIFDGYYALSADINYPWGYAKFNIAKTGSEDLSEIGFRGVFDGMGHSISGIKVEWYSRDAYYGGIFGVLHKNGVVKNVAFKNIPANACNGNLIANRGGGLIENVYVGYTGASTDANPWNCVANEASVSDPVIMHNCVIAYDTAWTNGYLLGKVQAAANAYRNVYIVATGDTACSSVIQYYSDETQSNVACMTPLGNDNFAHYASVGALLGEHKNEINGWGYFGANDTELSFNGVVLYTATESATANFNGNTLISADKTTSDYIIVYEDGNEDALNAAAFIAEQIQRASGTVTYTFQSGVVDGSTVTTAAQMKETVSGGIRLAVATQLPAAKTNDSAYIVVGNLAVSGAPTAATGKYIVKTDGNTVYIHADNSAEYITAAITFLEEAIGYKALSDDTVTYDKVNGSVVTIGSMDITCDTAFQVRSSTNAHHTWKNDQLALNGRSAFSIGPTDGNGKVQAFHNTIYWLDYANNSDKNWFRNDGADICYTNAKNDTEAVTLAATNIRKVLDDNPGETKVTFSLMDDDQTGCTCTTCKAGQTNAAVNFLNAVVEKIQELDGNPDREFTIYMLAYYYLLDAPTEDMNEHLGVIYAPVRNSYEALSIYDAKNDSVRTQISAWLNKTTNIGFWFYDTLYHNYMLFTDTFESMLTWFEYAARTVKAKKAEPVWIYVNGQTRQRYATAFEAFKQYAFSKAQAEILDKLGDTTGGTTEYTTKIKAYLTELEGEFFGFSVSGDTKSFSETGGYYGCKAANEAMYALYSQMRTDYATASASMPDKDAPYTTHAYIGQLAAGIAKTFNRVYDFLNQTNYTSVSWDYYSKDKIEKYMGYISTAQTAVNALSGGLSAVYQKHVLVESLCPRFMICVANGQFSSGYNGTALATMRSALKSDYNTLGITYYAEHYMLSDLYTRWDV